MRLLNRFSVKCVMVRCCVQDMAGNRDRWSRASRSGAVTRQGGDRNGLPWANVVQVHGRWRHGVFPAGRRPLGSHYVRGGPGKHLHA